MAVAMMGGEEKKPVFHDFLGMSCGESQPKAAAVSAGGWVKGGEKRMEEIEAEASSGGHGLVSGSSDLGSERQGVNNSEVFHFHGRKNAISGPESSNTLLGRKRSNSDSVYMGLIRERMIPVGSDSHESSHMMKMFGKEVVSEQPGRSHDEMLFTMQPPPRPTSSLILHPSVSSRPDSILSKWERSLPINHSQMMHYPSRFGQSGAYVEKLSSSYAPRDASLGAIFISQAAADEGSRTGIKGSGIMNVINATSGAVERNSTGVLFHNNRPKAPQTIEPESSNAPSSYSMASTTRQMTIFYAGQAHVFDDVHPNKADVIMALAGSSGGSWSTTYSPKSSVPPPVGEARLHGGENDMRAKNVALSIQGNPVHGLSQVTRIPVAHDPLSQTSGGHQAGRVDTRLSTPTAEPRAEGKRDA